MSNPDLARLINSDEIQSVVNPQKSGPVRRPRLRRNPLKNLGALLKLNPYAKTARRMEIVAHVSFFSICPPDSLQTGICQDRRRLASAHGCMNHV